MSRTSVIAALGAVALFACACGIPTTNNVQPISNPPRALVAGNSTTTSIPGGFAPVPVFFLRAGRLCEARPNVSAPPTSAKALIILGYGPTAAEAGRGVTTALSQSPQQATVSLYGATTNGTATVTLDSTFDGMFGTKLVDALGQIVYTVTAADRNIRGVQFILGGEPFDAFLPDSTITPRGVNQHDYREIAPAQAC